MSPFQMLQLLGAIASPTRPGLTSAVSPVEKPKRGLTREGLPCESCALFAALDANGDEIIDADDLERAATARRETEKDVCP